MGIFEEAREEEALQAHIRRLLYDYAKEHLTTSYVEFTERAVAELLSQSLHEIPIADSTSIRLPEEPFNVLTRLYALNDLKPYNEQGTRSTDVMKYLKTFLSTLKQGTKLRSERAVEIDDCYIPEERFVPMLSRRARRETLRPGSNDFRKSLKTPYGAFMKSSEVGIKPVEVQVLKEPAVKLEKVLNVTWSLPHDTGIEVRDLLKSMATLAYPGPSYKNPYLDPSSRPDSPPLQLGPGSSLFYESGDGFVPFEPIFSRAQRPGFGRAKPKERNEGPVMQPIAKSQLFGIRKTKDKGKDVDADMDTKDLFALGLPPPRSISQVVPRLSTVTVDEDEGFDLLKENMKIVNGWETYHTSSPAQASGASSLSSVTTPRSSQEVDELNLNLAISSPNTDLSPIKLLKESRMDLPLMPRSKRNILSARGSTATKTKKIGAKQSYAAFLLETLNKRNNRLSKKDEPLPPIFQDKIPEALPVPLSSLRNDLRSSPILDFDEPDVNPLIDKTPMKAEAASIVKENFDDAASMAGQVGSTVAVDSLATGMRGTDNTADVDIFESELHAIFKDVQTEDPLGLIMREKLDPMKNGKEMLMEVPTLPAPNKHPPNDDVLFPASGLRQYVVPSGTGANRGREKNKVYQFLRKAKGTASATLELSWVPFAVTTSLPTQEEILTVHDFYDKNTSILNGFDRLGMTKEQGLARVEELSERAEEACRVAENDNVNHNSDAESRAERIWTEWSHHGDQITSSALLSRADVGKIDIVLSREERRRSKGPGSSKVVERVADDCENGETAQLLDDPEEEERGVNSAERTAAVAGDFEGMAAVAEYHSRTSLTSAPANLNTQHLFNFTSDAAPPSQVYDAELSSRAETDFGIPSFLEESDIAIHTHDRALHADDQPLESFAAVQVLDEYLHTNQYGYEFVDEFGSDSDKENQDPSNPEAIAQVTDLEWDHSDTSLLLHGQRERPNYQQDEDDRNRLAKRPRLYWEGDDRYQSREYRYDDGGPEVEDSGIGLLDYLSCSPARAVNMPPNATQDDQAYIVNRVLFEDNHPADDVNDERIQNYFDLEDDPISTQLQNSDFVPLAFDSQPVPDAQSQQPWPPSTLQSAPRGSFSKKAAPFIIPFHDHSVGIAEFARLRARKLRTPPPAPEPPKPTTAESDSFEEVIASKIAPEAIFDKNTLRLPGADRTLRTTAHWYMASMNLIQKQALVRSLRSGICGVGLVEREMLTGVDLIIDPHTAVIFTNLLALPSEVDVLINTICEQSWRYDHLLVVFEAFVPSMSFKPDSAASAKESLSAYSPPVLKAIRKFRRDVSLAEACGNKREGCQVMTAFAETVQDAAVFARTFGDKAERRGDNATGLWDSRAWLDDGVGEDEENLAAADGMNHFAACAVLCQITLDELLEISPEERIARFSLHLGYDRMVKLNEVIDHGRQVIDDGVSVIEE
ncbi:hypothetical protein F5879DRAFT_1005368 [Lentinula edodes]|nr:hypothetical protein F5879DRAFT_1005368 [Lentinula edodes]